MVHSKITKSYRRDPKSRLIINSLGKLYLNLNLNLLLKTSDCFNEYLLFSNCLENPSIEAILVFKFRHSLSLEAELRHFHNSPKAAQTGFFLGVLLQLYEPLGKCSTSYKTETRGIPPKANENFTAGPKYEKFSFKQPRPRKAMVCTCACVCVGAGNLPFCD